MSGLRLVLDPRIDREEALDRLREAADDEGLILWNPEAVTSESTDFDAVIWTAPAGAVITNPEARIMDGNR